MDKNTARSQEDVCTYHTRNVKDSPHKGKKKKKGLIYLDEIGVDVVCVIFRCGERELYSAVVN